MKLLIIAGFLGSGKTTLLLHIAKQLSRQGKKIVIIENEIGQIGIDGEYLKLHGLEVQELFGGCICCTLSTNLIETLDKIENNFTPDIIILEATGAARPGDITETLNQYRHDKYEINTITIVDALRFDMLMEVMEPLIKAQILAGDKVILNKIESLDQSDIDTICAKISNITPMVKLEAISCKNRAHLDSFMIYINKFMETLL